MELWESMIFAILTPMFTPEQCRAARGLLGWSQQELARQARVGVVTVHQLETGVSEPRRATIEVIQRAFEDAGVTFIDENGGGPGVRLRKSAVKRNK
jgi:predicted transcriptional regulator